LEVANSSPLLASAKTEGAKLLGISNMVLLAMRTVCYSSTQWLERRLKMIKTIKCMILIISSITVRKRIQSNLERID
jgi:hypothetical protein